MKDGVTHNLGDVVVSTQGRVLDIPIDVMISTQG